MEVGRVEVGRWVIRGTYLFSSCKTMEKHTGRLDLVVDSVQPPSKKGTKVEVPYLSLHNLALLAPTTTAWERLSRGRTPSTEAVP